jgi:uncharacterized protein (DUF697 family)
MNKKKLPKVILSLNDEAHPANPPDIPSAMGQQSSADHNGVRDRTVSELPSQATDNVVQLIPPADSGSTGSPHVTVQSGRRRSRALAIVDRYAACSAIGGLVPLALVNFAGITTIIVRMVKVLCNHYGVPFKHDRARAIVIGLVGGAMPTGAAAITTSTLLYIAPPTAVLGLAVSSVTAAVFTRSVGRVFIEHFEGGASLDAFSAPQG